MFIIKDKQVRPARVRVSATPSYTLDELHDLVNRYGDMADELASGAESDGPDLIVRLALSGFVEWLRRREKEVGDE